MKETWSQKGPSFPCIPYKYPTQSNHSIFGHARQVLPESDWPNTDVIA